MKRAIFVSVPLVVLVTAGVLVAPSMFNTPMTLTASVREADVSKMVTAKGAVSAAKTVNMNFLAANNITVVDVKVGDKVKKGQKLGEESNGGFRRAVLQAQQLLAQQQAALDLVLNDVNPEGLWHIWQANKRAVDQAWRNIELKVHADEDVAHRQDIIVRQDKEALRKAEAARDAIPMCYTGSPIAGTAPCSTALAAVTSAKSKLFTDHTTLINNINAIKVDRGSQRSLYRTARINAASAYNAWNVARVNRPSQIAAARAVVANALVGVGNAVGNLTNSYVYAPVDGVVSAIAGTVGEFNAGGSNLTPNSPNAPGSTARVPNTGALAGNDQKSLTGGQGPNLGLQAVLPGGNTFMQISDINAFSAVAAFPENEAVRMAPGSSAKVSFDALPGKEVDGQVASVAPNGAPGVNGAPMYYATVLLNSPPKELKGGMTANVSVVTDTVENKAMVVPTAAVSRDGAQSFVQVPGADGKPMKKEFTAGKVGDDNTQVLSGLKKDDKVFIPDSGPLPTPKSDDAPKVPTEQVINVEHPKAKPVDKKVEDVAGAPEPVAPAAPAPPLAAGQTFPGDPGELPPDASDTGSASAAGNPNAGLAGVNPFAPMQSGSAPAPQGGGN